MAQFEALVWDLFRGVETHAAGLVGFALDHNGVPQIETLYRRLQARLRVLEAHKDLALKAWDAALEEVWSQRPRGEYPAGVVFKGPRAVEEKLDRAWARIHRVEKALDRLMFVLAHCPEDQVTVEYENNTVLPF